METTPKAMLVIFAFIVAFAYFVISEFNKEAALTALQTTRAQSEGLAKVLADRRNYLKQQQNLRSAAETSQRVVAESTRKLETLRASEETERTALRDAQARIHDTHKRYIDAVRATVGGFVGTKTASIRLKSNKTLTNLTLTAATEEALTFSHDAGITKVMNADLSDESRALFGLPAHRELAQILEEYRNTEQAGPSQPPSAPAAVPAAPPVMAGGTSAKPASSAEIAALEAQLAAVQAEHDKLLESAKTLRTDAQGSSIKSREAIADKLNERMLELQTLIKNAKGQP